MLTISAPAKINWFLLVLGKRDDGYHEIQSLMQCVGLFDELRLEKSGSLEVLGTDIPRDENLVYKAARTLREAAGVKAGARITLRKRIPLAAGLGGGSSDAAAALKGLAELWGIRVPEAELVEMAAGLGSDVPFFLGPPAALVGGRGQVVEPVALGRPWTLLLVKPPIGVSAGWAYANLRGYSPSEADASLLVRALETGDHETLREGLRNDLEPAVAARHPEVADIKKTLLDSGALLSMMSGSGPTVFGLFDDPAAAEQASLSLSPLWSAVVRTLH